MAQTKERLPFSPLHKSLNHETHELRKKTHELNKGTHKLKNEAITEADWQALGISGIEPFGMLNPA